MQESWDHNPALEGWNTNLPGPYTIIIIIIIRVLATWFIRGGRFQNKYRDNASAERLCDDGLLSRKNVAVFDKFEFPYRSRQYL